MGKLELPKIVKDLGHSTLEVIGRRIANNVFAQMIKPFTPAQVHAAIVNNISLWDRWGEEEKKSYLEYGSRYKDIIVSNMDLITTKSILVFMAEKGTPWIDQVEIIVNTPGGTGWFETQVEEIKRGIREYYYGHSE